ncbi:MAG: ribonuclease III [Oscillospiraceae bacterium]|nr:ribonuclease III [Oscillospiraceae bacterium]
MRLYPQNIDIKTLSPLALAFVGDGVFSLMVRERLVCEANRAAGKLHKLSVEQVRAEGQAGAARRILPLLTEKETAVFRRGRNAHTTRNSDEYHLATGLEALFGYLYLRDEQERLRALFELGMRSEE